MAGLIVLDPLLGDDGAARMLDLWKDFGSYGLYSNEGFDTRFAPGLAQRYDAALNFVRTGGRFARQEDPAVLAARTNYFRETYVYGEDVALPGAHDLLFHHEGLTDAARRLHGRPVIEPTIVYANVLAPGQELAVHTDVPEFRGANRKVTPQWLLVAMHHSGLFDEWRMPIATGIAYFGGGEGGELAYYPEGRNGPAATYAPRHDTAVVLDTDTVFHGVDRVRGDDSRVAAIRPGMRMRYQGDERWVVGEPDGDGVAEPVAEYRTDELRLSVSWKAYCFADDAERDAWRTHSDDLTLDTILDRLADDLGQRPDDDEEFGRLVIDHYIRFPEASGANAGG